MCKYLNSPLFVWSLLVQIRSQSLIQIAVHFTFVMWHETGHIQWQKCQSGLDFIHWVVIRSWKVVYTVIVKWLQGFGVITQNRTFQRQSKFNNLIKDYKHNHHFYKQHALFTIKPGVCINSGFNWFKMVSQPNQAGIYLFNWLANWKTPE